MNDVIDELREVLHRRADEVPPHREVPGALVNRSRRRIALNALGVAVTVVVLAGAAFAGVRALGGPVAREPGAGPPGTSSTPPSASPDAPCMSAQLRAVGSFEGAAGSREGAIAVTNRSDEPCTLRGTPAITLLDQNLEPITSGIQFTDAPPGWVANGLPTPAGWPVVNLAPGGSASVSASVRIRWSNWCPDGRAAPAWRMEAPGGGTAPVSGLDSLGPPPCNGPGQPSTVEVGPFEPSAGS